MAFQLNVPTSIIAFQRVQPPAAGVSSKTARCCCRRKNRARLAIVIAIVGAAFGSVRTIDQSAAVGLSPCLTR